MKIRLIFFLCTLFLNLIGQTKIDSLDLIEKQKITKEINALIEEDFKELERVSKFKTDFKAILIDTVWGQCGGHFSVGAFLFKTIEKKPKEIIVVVQCANRAKYRSMLEVGKKYKLSVTPEKSKLWFDHIWGKYENRNYQKFYELETTLIK